MSAALTTMSKDWNQIRRQGAWAETLSLLIKEAKAALKAGPDQRSGVREDLRQFVDQSPNFDDSVPIDKYDEVAGRLHKQLVQADLEEELARMENRQPAFTEIAAEMRQIAGDANELAGKISLTRVRKVVDSVAEAVESLREMRDTLEEQDQAKLVKTVDELLKAFQSLQKQVDAS